MTILRNLVDAAEAIAGTVLLLLVLLVVAIWRPRRRPPTWLPPDYPAPPSRLRVCHRGDPCSDPTCGVCYPYDWAADDDFERAFAEWRDAEAGGPSPWPIMREIRLEDPEGES